MLKTTKPPNQNQTIAEPRQAKVIQLQYDLRVPFEGSRDLSLMKEFMRYKLPEFDGRMDPLAAEEWMRKTEKILSTMRIIRDDDRIQLAMHQLDNETDQWWQDEKETMDTTGLTWRRFRGLFFNKYFPPIEREKKWEEFKELKW